MAKFGQLFLQKGKWNGNELLPAAWIEEATTRKIDQVPDAPQAKKDSSDWMQGYCYQMWRCRHNAFRADGAYGQYIIVLPDQDAVIAVTAETADMQSELNLIWDYLLPAIKPSKLPENSGLAANLKQRLLSLSLSLPVSYNGPVDASKISGKTFVLDLKEKHTINFQFSDSICKVTMMMDSVRNEFSFGSGRWINGETTLPGPDLLLHAKAHLVGLPPAKVAGSYAWKDENTLELVLRYIESPHSETIACKFDKNDLLMDIHYRIMPENAKTELKGVTKD